MRGDFLMINLVESCLGVFLLGKKLIYNGNSTVLLFPTNKIMTFEKIILRVTVLLIENNKK